MNKELAHTISDIIWDLSSQLGVGAENVWGTVVKQVIISGWFNIGLAVAFFMLTIFSVWLLIKVVKDEDFFLVGAFLSFFVMATIYNTSLGIKRLINPEYYAMEKISEMIRGNN